LTIGNSSRTEWNFGVAPWYKINDRWSVGGLYRLELTDYAHEDQCAPVALIIVILTVIVLLTDLISICGIKTIG